jgi:predicted metal-dependent hydrolase
VRYTDISGNAADIAVIRKSVKTARIIVLADGSLRVIAPASLDVNLFLARHEQWIAIKREQLERLSAEGCGKEDMLLFKGRFCRMAEGKRFSIDEDAGIVTSPSPAAIRKNLALLVKEEVVRNAERYPALTGTGFGRVTVKMQRTKWASCSSRGNLNFNLRVMALPDTLREYILIHELAHLRQHDHSHAFWDLVSRYYPGYRTAEQELKRYWVLLERNRVWSRLREA